MDTTSNIIENLHVVDNLREEMMENPPDEMMENPPDEMMDNLPEETMGNLPENTMETLPEEVRVEILAQALRFPNGIHSDRWRQLKTVRVDKYLKMPGWAHMIPESLFKYNKLIIKESRPYHILLDERSEDNLFALTYPDKLLARWVKNLELQISLLNFWHGHNAVQKAAGRHAGWLQKLANLELGFEKLETLKIMIVTDEHRDGREDNSVEMDYALHEILGFLETRFGAMSFTCKELQLEVLQHTCSDACVDNPTRECGHWKRLNRLFSATGTPASTVV